MSRSRRVLLLVAVLIAACWLWERMAPLGDDTMEYRGEKIKLSKRFNSYEAYKDDPNNIAPSELARVQKMVIEAPVARSYPDRKAMIGALFEIKFPGYGIGGFPARAADGGEFQAESIEIPGTEKERVFLFRSVSGHLELADDFVTEALIASMREENGDFVYFDVHGNESLRRPAPKR